MKTSSLKLVASLLASATLTLAQTSGYNNTQAPSPESVRPGSLNYVEGQVSSNGQPLDPHEVGHFALQPGQSLETGNGYAEVLLTPGAFLRIGPNSEFRLTSVGLADTRINLGRGNALIEADQVIAGTHLEVTVVNTSGDLLKKGLYEFSVNPQDMRVFDGKLNVVGTTKSREIGKGDQIALANGDNLKKVSFDLNQAKTDPIYVWSEARSRDEASRNQLVAQNPVGYAPVGGGWFWDPYAGYYGFWPSAYLYSPFGFGFYGGYYPGFYGGYYGGYRGGYRGGFLHAGGRPSFNGVHGNGVGGGFHGGGFGGGGFHAAGGGGRR
jgi:hypothetical protein